MSDNRQNFTLLAQKALELARSEAERLGNNYIGAEHLMLGCSLCLKAAQSRLCKD